MSVRCIIPYKIVDLRDEIAEFERKYRPFPPKSGSVSKPYLNLNPDEEEKHLKELSFLRVSFVIEGEMKLRATTRTTTAATAATDTDGVL